MQETEGVQWLGIAHCPPDLVSQMEPSCEASWKSCAWRICLPRASFLPSFFSFLPSFFPFFFFFLSSLLPFSLIFILPPPYVCVCNVSCGSGGLLLWTPAGSWWVWLPVSHLTVKILLCCTQPSFPSPGAQLPDLFWSQLSFSLLPDSWYKWVTYQLPTRDSLKCQYLRLSPHFSFNLCYSPWKLKYQIQLLIQYHP